MKEKIHVLNKNMILHLGFRYILHLVHLNLITQKCNNYVIATCPLVL